MNSYQQSNNPVVYYNTSQIEKRPRRRLIYQTMSLLVFNFISTKNLSITSSHCYVGRLRLHHILFGSRTASLIIYQCQQLCQFEKKELKMFRLLNSPGISIM